MAAKRENIFIAGHKGMVGSAIMREFNNIGEKNIFTKDKIDLDLMNQKNTYETARLSTRYNGWSLLVIVSLWR